jgi:hypothetical protein
MVSPAGIFSAGDFSMQPISVEFQIQKKHRNKTAIENHYCRFQKNSIKKSLAKTKGFI